MSCTSGVINKLNKKLGTVKEFMANTRTARTERSNRPPNRTQEELQESLHILRESNKRLRRQVLDKEDEIEKSKQANLLLKKELETKQEAFEEERRMFSEQIRLLKKEVNEKEVRIGVAEEHHVSLIKEYEVKIIHLKKELLKNDALLQENKYELEEMKPKVRENLHESYKRAIKKILKERNNETLDWEKENCRLMKDLDYLRQALELQKREIKCLRQTVAEEKRNDEILNISLEKLKLLRAKCENLQDQHKRTSEFEEYLKKKKLNLRKINEKNEQRSSWPHNNEIQ